MKALTSNQINKLLLVGFKEQKKFPGEFYIKVKNWLTGDICINVGPRQIVIERYTRRSLLRDMETTNRSINVLVSEIKVLQTKK